MKAPLTIPILYIDDFLRNKQPTQAEIKLAFSIIDTRYQNGLKTIISSEKSLKELHGIDEALTGRIYERTNKKEYYIDISRNPNYNFRRADI